MPYVPFIFEPIHERGRFTGNFMVYMVCLMLFVYIRFEKKGHIGFITGTCLLCPVLFGVAGRAWIRVFMVYAYLKSCFGMCPFRGVRDNDGNSGFGSRFRGPCPCCAVESCFRSCGFHVFRGLQKGHEKGHISFKKGTKGHRGPSGPSDCIILGFVF